MLHEYSAAVTVWVERERGYKGPQCPVKVCSCHITGTHERGKPETRTNYIRVYVASNLQPAMESMQELIPFAKEMMSQKPSRGLLKVYLLGSVFAVLGAVIGLVETACHPFSCGEPMDEELILMMGLEQRSAEAEMQRAAVGQEKEEQAHENGAVTQTVTFQKTHTLSQRSMANRLHAS